MQKIISFIAICAAQIATAQTPFKAGCTLPFKVIKVVHTIDKTCPIQGSPIKINKEANLKQNRAKNNFCATGEAKVVKVKDLVDKHQKVIESGVSFGTPAAVPLDRKVFVDLGEGTVVSFTGYIFHAKVANKSSGEAVNCKRKNEENNDLHLDMIETKTEVDPCQKITAEVSPHFRPESWNVDSFEDLEEKKIKVRLTGHLLFDASHGSCLDSDEGYRASSWEIHPVYRVEVYVGKKWIDLNEWVEE